MIKVIISVIVCLVVCLVYDSCKMIFAGFGTLFIEEHVDHEEETTTTSYRIEVDDLDILQKKRRVVLKVKRTQK